MAHSPREIAKRVETTIFQQFQQFSTVSTVSTVSTISRIASDISTTTSELVPWTKNPRHAFFYLNGVLPERPGGSQGGAEAHYDKNYGKLQYFSIFNNFNSFETVETVEIVENSTIGVQQLKNQRSFFSELKKPNSKIYTYHTKPDPTENPSENSKIHGFGPGSGPGPGSTLIALFYY